MAYDIMKVDGKYRVFKQGDMKKAFGTHDTRRDAEAQMRAILHSEDKPSPLSPGVRAEGKGMVLNDSYIPEPITRVYVDGRAVNTES